MKALVLFSGGVDSTTCLAEAVEKYGKDEVIALSVSYGQKHIKELEASEKIAEYYGVRYKKLDLTPIFADSDCSLLQGSENDIPKESYAEQLKKTDGKPVSTYVPFRNGLSSNGRVATYVPFRNGLFLSIAAAYADSIFPNEKVEIYYGAHADDAAGNAYPDCSKDFNDSINKAIYLGSGGQLTVKAPFVDMNKSDVIARGLKLNVPYRLTWSCYEGSDRPCGKCGTCLDRAAAFRANGINDPALEETE